jgi:hypothetical protein
MKSTFRVDARHFPGKPFGSAGVAIEVKRRDVPALIEMLRDA